MSIKKIKFSRPGTGIPTTKFDKVEGRRAKINIAPETIIKWNMLKNE